MSEKRAVLQPAALTSLTLSLHLVLAYEQSVLLVVCVDVYPFQTG